MWWGKIRRVSIRMRSEEIRNDTIRYDTMRYDTMRCEANGGYWVRCKYLLKLFVSTSTRIPSIHCRANCGNWKGRKIVLAVYLGRFNILILTLYFRRNGNFRLALKHILRGWLWKLFWIVCFLLSVADLLHAITFLKELYVALIFLGLSLVSQVFLSFAWQSQSKEFVGKCMTLAFYLGVSLILNIYPTAGINLVVTVKQKTLLRTFPWSKIQAGI